MFEWNEPYEETDPYAIRSDFAELAMVYDNNAHQLAIRLANYISTDTLRKFLDDLAMDRI